MAERPIDDIWAEALGALAGMMTRETFDTWLSGTWPISADGDQWVIGVRSAFALDWLENRLGGLVVRALALASGRRGVAVRFQVATPLAAEPRRLTDPVPTLDERGPIVEAVREERIELGASGGALQWTDFYIKLKVAFRKRALKRLKGARLSVFLCLALHVDRDGIAKPNGIEAIMFETGYSRGAVCSALGDLVDTGLIEKIPQHHGPDQYRVLGYAWFGQEPAPSLWEEKRGRVS